MQQLQITCRDNQKMCVDIRLKQFLRAWSAIFDEDEEIIDFRADPQMIEVINVFYQMHEYKLENIYVADTIQSHKIEDCVDAQSVIFLSKIYYKCDNIQELIDWVRNMVPLLDESYRLDAKEITNVLNTAIGVFFFIQNATEQEIQQFCQRVGMQYPLTPIQQRQIVQDNKPIFDKT